MLYFQMFSPYYVPLWRVLVPFVCHWLVAVWVSMVIALIVWEAGFVVCYLLGMCCVLPGSIHDWDAARTRNVCVVLCCVSSMAPTCSFVCFDCGTKIDMFASSGTMR